MTLLEQWRNSAYEQERDARSEQMFWANYFNYEKGIYEQILKTPDEPVIMVGFLDGINDSLKNPNPIETMDENTEVNLDYDMELLYKNMVGARAEWLYELPEWDALIDADRRKELYKEQKLSTTIVKGKKIGRNDPCPCGSGKKYKKCCGRR